MPPTVLSVGSAFRLEPTVVVRISGEVGMVVFLNWVDLIDREFSG
jgi:hypothetical protein